MGMVVKAIDERLNKVVAVKMLFENSNKAELARFRQEAKVASVLDHKNIVKLLDFGVADGDLPFMVMEYIEGEDLASLLSKRGALEVPEAKELFTQLFSAMQYAHSKGVFHRDIKPSNIMLVSEGGNITLKLVDFGIAKVANGITSLEDKLTQTGQILGSPKYMSPEQALGKAVDGRTDIYSSGCVLYHALTGAPPITGNSPIETLFNQINSTPLRISEASLGKKFSPQLEDVVQKSISKRPEDRQQSFAELFGDLENALSLSPQSPTAAQGTTPAVASKASSNFPKVPIAVLTIAIVCCVCAYAFQLNKHKAPDSTTQNKDAPGSSPQPTLTVGSKPESEDMTQAAPQVFELDATADGIAKASIIHFAQADKKEVKLHVNDRMVTDATIEVLVHEFKNEPERLRELDFRSTSITDRGMQLLSTLGPRFQPEKLAVGKTKIGEKGLQIISRFTSLQRLDISELQNLKPDSLVPLKNLQSLRDLNIGGCYKDTSPPINLEFLPHLHQLQSISFSRDRGGINDNSAKYFLSLNHLRGVDLSWTDFGDQGFKQLCQLSRLEKIEVVGKNITDKAIPAVGNVTGLKRLILDSSSISEKSLNVLAELFEQGKLDLTELSCINAHV